MIDQKTIEGMHAALAAPDRFTPLSPWTLDECAALLADRAGLIALLREVEWEGDISEGAGRPWLCPVCLGNPKLGHASDCRLAAALR